jgi:O-antigen/teichoic acid export membrane protein
MVQENQDIKKNSLISLFSLFFQSGYAAILGLVANLILTIVLSPKIYGIYILTLAIIPFLNFFSDIGLGAALVQKKEVTDKDIKTTFTIQQILVIGIVSLAFLLTPFIRNFYNLPNEATYLYWAVLFSFFLSSLKTIPAIKLERNVQFQKIVLVQIVENTVFYIAVSILAILNFGLATFTYAILIRSSIGVILMYSLSFWLPKFGIYKESIKSLLRFGVPFQLNIFLALLKDDLVLFYLGRVVGLEGLAYIGWAKRWAEAPIRIVMDNISKVLFPVFSRIQENKEGIGRLIEKVLRYQTMVLAPLFMGAVMLLDEVVNLIPKYNKWEPAMPLFYIFVISAFLSSYSSPFTNLFNSVGKIKTTLYFMIYWTVMTWISVPLFTHFFGLYGFPISLVILSLSFVVIVPLARKIVSFNFLSNIKPYFLASIIMGVAVYFSTLIGVNWISFSISVATGIATYTLALKIFFKINIIHQVKTFFKT